MKARISRQRAGVAFHANNLRQILRIGAAIVKVAIAGQWTWTLVASQRRLKLPAVARYADFILRA